MKTTIALATLLMLGLPAMAQREPTATAFYPPPGSLHGNPPACSNNYIVKCTPSATRTFAKTRQSPRRYRQSH
jgi:hypothetical protein